jgi:mRNA interferase MazF
LEVKRGDLIVAALQGDYGKPRPMLVVQIDLYAHLHSIAVLPLTSEIIEAPRIRVSIEPAPGNGLRVRSQVMIDKPATIPRAKIGKRIGTLDPASMTEVGRCLAIFFGIAK